MALALPTIPMIALSILFASGSLACDANDGSTGTGLDQLAGGGTTTAAHTGESGLETTTHSTSTTACGDAGSTGEVTSESVGDNSTGGTGSGTGGDSSGGSGETSSTGSDSTTETSTSDGGTSSTGDDSSGGTDASTGDNSTVTGTTGGDGGSDGGDDGSELPALSCSLEDNLASQSSSEDSEVRVFNETRRTIRLYWLDYSGNRKRYRDLAPGASRQLSTSVSHPWVIADESGKCKEIYVVLEARDYEIHVRE